VAPRMATLGGRVGHGRGAPGVGGRRILRGQEEGAGHWPRSSAHQAGPMVSPDLAKGLPHRSPLGGWGWEVAPCTRGVPRTAQLAAAPGVHGVPLSPSVPPPSVPPASSPKCRPPPAPYPLPPARATPSLVRALGQNQCPWVPRPLLWTL
jgi:hypothetical protein